MDGFRFSAAELLSYSITQCQARTADLVDIRRTEELAENQLFVHPVHNQKSERRSQLADRSALLVGTA